MKAVAPGLFPRRRPHLPASTPIATETATPERALEVGINLGPLRALGFQIDCIRADGDVAVEMHPNKLEVMELRLAGLFSVFGQIREREQPILAKRSMRTKR
jgi:hypothetical protein